MGVLFIAIASVVAIAVHGQQLVTGSDFSDILGKLRSPSGPERSEAFESIRSNQAALKNLKVRSALLDLLDRENHELDSRLADKQKGGSADEGDGESEGFGIYYSDLLDTVESFADWNDPRQVCILVNAASSDDSAFAGKIADHAKFTIPCLLKRTVGDAAINRSIAVPILAQALAKGKDALDAGTLNEARQAVLHGLQDSDEGVRIFTVHALAKFGGQDMIPALTTLANTDPSPEVQGRSIRKAALDAVSAIQRRTSQ